MAFVACLTGYVEAEEAVDRVRDSFRPGLLEIVDSWTHPLLPRGFTIRVFDAEHRSHAELSAAFREQGFGDIAIAESEATAVIGLFTRPNPTGVVLKALPTYWDHLDD